MTSKASLECGGPTPKRLLARTDVTGELRKFSWSERNIVLRVKYQPISVELEIQRGIERCFVEDDFYGVRVWRSPGAAGGNQWIRRNAQKATESVSKQTAPRGPRLSINCQARFAGSRSDNDGR